MWWIICVAVVIIFCFFIKMRNESNEIDVSKDLSISPSCNFQINGNGLRERKIQNLEISRTNIIKVLKEKKEKGTQCQLIGSSTLVPIREDLRKERNNSLNKVHNIDFGIINNKNKNKEDMSFFRRPGIFRQRLEELEKIEKQQISRRYRDIKLKTKNMPAPNPIKDKKLDK